MRLVPYVLACLSAIGAAPVEAQTSEMPAELYALGWVRGDGAEVCPTSNDLQQEVGGAACTPNESTDCSR
jgi:hypothetical protein